jgi:subtilisin-like proprotein convertase family protein
MTLPGGVVKMGWTMMEETPGTWTLRVEDKEIGDVVGFKGLNVSTVSVGTEDGADMM